MALFDNAEIGVPCPQCGHKTKKKLAWIKAHTEMACAGCGQLMVFDSAKLKKELGVADKAMSDFRRNLARLGKRR